VQNLVHALFRNVVSLRETGTCFTGFIRRNDLRIPFGLFDMVCLRLSSWAYEVFRPRHILPFSINKNRPILPAGLGYDRDSIYLSMEFLGGT